MFDWVFQPSGWLALATLTAMEIVLGIDNVIFISLIGARLPKNQSRFARIFGLSLALLFRLACLSLLTWLIALTKPVLTVLGHPMSWRDIVLIVAGLFLITQATLELHSEIDEGSDEDIADQPKEPRNLVVAIITIAAMDLVFSFDSILTAIGIAKDLVIMVIAIMIALVVMYAASNIVASFIHRNPTTKVLALCFLVLIGMALTAEGSGFEIPRGYLYFAMVFAGGVETLNVWSRRRRRKRAAMAADHDAAGIPSPSSGGP